MEGDLVSVRLLVVLRGAAEEEGGKRERGSVSFLLVGGKS